MRSGTLSITMALAAAVLSLVTAGTASAKGGRRLGPPVMTAGVCSDGQTTFTLKSQFDDDAFPQTVGAEFQIDSGVIGQQWEVTLTDNGAAPFFDQIVPTIGPEGALNVTHPEPGAFDFDHTIVATGTNQADGTVCTGTVVLPKLTN